MFTTDRLVDYSPLGWSKHHAGRLALGSRLSASANWHLANGPRQTINKDVSEEISNEGSLKAQLHFSDWLAAVDGSRTTARRKGPDVIPSPMEPAHK
jgi:hypothetical protein